MYIHIYFFLGTEAFCEVRWSPIVLREHVLSRREKNIVTRKTLSGTLATICPYTHTHTHKYSRIYNERWNCRWRLLYSPIPHTHSRTRASEGGNRYTSVVRTEKERFYEHHKWRRTTVIVDGWRVVYRHLLKYIPHIALCECFAPWETVCIIYNTYIYIYMCVCNIIVLYAYNMALSYIYIYTTGREKIIHYVAH